MRSLSDPAFRIRFAERRDAEELAALAARTFRDTYAGTSHADDDLERYVAEHHAVAATLRRLADPAVALFVAEASDGALVGFAELRESDVPAAVAAAVEAAMPDARALELGRLYVDRAWFGRGPAGALLAAAVAEARRRGAGGLWLVVWEHNDRAKAFYAKHGFRAIGRHPFRVGEQSYEDDLMIRTLDPGGGS